MWRRPTNVAPPDTRQTPWGESLPAPLQDGGRESPPVVVGCYMGERVRRVKLFVDHPLSPATLPSGRLTTSPYHCYDADALILAGDVDAAAATAILADEKLSPVRVTTGHAVASLWLMRYLDTSLGPYTEVVLTMAATAAPASPRAIDYVADYAALLLDPDVIVFCHRLLLPTTADLAIAYGRELLHFDKEGVDLKLVRGATTEVKVDGRLSADIGVHAPASTQLGGMVRVMRAAGLVRTLRALSAAEIAVRAPARLGGGTVRSLLRGRIVLRPFDAARDRLTYTAGLALTDDLVRLAFTPKLVQRIPHAQFVMYPAVSSSSCLAPFSRIDLRRTGCGPRPAASLARQIPSRYVPRSRLAAEAPRAVGLDQFD